MKNYCLLFNIIGLVSYYIFPDVNQSHTEKFDAKNRSADYSFLSGIYIPEPLVKKSIQSLPTAQFNQLIKKIV